MQQSTEIQFDPEVLEIARSIQATLKDPLTQSLSLDQLFYGYAGMVEDLRQNVEGLIEHRADPDFNLWNPLIGLLVIAILARRSPDPTVPSQ